MGAVYAESNDAYHRKASTSTWADARGTAISTSDFTSSSGTLSSIATWNIYSGGRGSNTYYCARSFFEFDLSSYSGTATDVEFKLYCDNIGTNATNESTLYLVNSTALAGSTADFGNVFTMGTTLGTFFGSGEISTTASYHTIALNSDGLTATNSAIGSGNLTIGIMGYYDYNVSTPSLGGNQAKLWARYQNYTGTSYDPYINITYEPTTTSNAIFFGTNF
tara:strand:- start:204 stop:866 length:663 start_codon:yes stop_codon:yes gene_type:complete